ncbi:RNB domain-containing ribonuclease [bacterium]|nr:RNB domain-containing ribonuclease [bacterium]
MAESLEVVTFERRGRLSMGALKGGGEKNARVVDDLGETLKVSLDKVLHRFRARIEDGDAREVKERLKALEGELLAGAPGAVDLDLLWDSLEDERVYSLAQLAELYFGEATDRGVAALVRALGEGGDGDEPPYHFRTRPGGLARTDRETFEKIKARLDGERRRREREAAFRVWFEESARAARKNDGARPFEKPPEEQAEHLHVLADYALAGDRSQQAARARRLAADLGLSDPDELLVLLEKGGCLARDANELPHRAGVPIVFSHRVRAEAESIAQAPFDPSRALEEEKRVDFRGKPTTAIDDATTEDVDDGFSLWEEGGELVLAVHIADVARTVPQGSDLDEDAKRRATTIYFPGQTIPMLPPVLQRARLSLDAGVDRPVVSFVTRIRADGSLAPGKFARGIARVDRRLTYDETLAPPEEWREPLRRLEPVAARLRAARASAGALLLELPDLKITIDSSGEPHLALVSSDTPGHRIVSELMVLYNHELGGALRDGRLAAIFRTQRDAVAKPAVAPDDPLYAVRARRGLPPTTLEVDAGPHRTLGVDAYVQGSSPIRRYGDLVAQRQLASLLAGTAPSYSKEDVRALSIELERAERNARRLEAERDLYWICRWLDHRRKEVLPGVVSRSPEGGRGLVYLPGIHMELPLGEPEPPVDLPEGSPVHVVVRRCSARRRTVTFACVGGEGAASPSSVSTDSPVP